MTTKHTPGPWQVYNGGSVIGTAEDKDGALYIAEARYIANGESAANARLIAAAPDLHDFAATCESIGEKQLAAMDLSLALDTIRTMRALASVALAKARGEG